MLPWEAEATELQPRRLIDRPFAGEGLGRRECPLLPRTPSSAATPREYRTPPPAIIIGRLQSRQHAGQQRRPAPAAGGGREIRQVPFERRVLGKVMSVRPARPQATTIVTAPVSTGLVRIRIASGSAVSSCSGRLIRSKNRLTGRKQSFTLTCALFADAPTAATRAPRARAA